MLLVFAFGRGGEESVEEREILNWKKEEVERKRATKRAITIFHSLLSSVCFPPLNSNHERPRPPLLARRRPAPQQRHRSRQRGRADQQDRGQGFSQGDLVVACRRRTFVVVVAFSSFFLVAHSPRKRVRDRAIPLLFQSRIKKKSAESSDIKIKVIRTLTRALRAKKAADLSECFFFFLFPFSTPTTSTPPPGRPHRRDLGDREAGRLLPLLEERHGESVYIGFVN